MTDSHTWTLALGGAELLTANDRDGHWGRRHRNTAQLRGAAVLAARAAKLPALERARIVAVVRPPKEPRRMDPANTYPTVKAYIDGLVKAGLLPDDNGWRLIGPDMRLGDPFPPWGRFELRIAELPPVARLTCKTAAAAAAVIAKAPEFAPPGLDLEHRAKASGRVVSVMWTDRGYLNVLTEWAICKGYAPALPMPDSAFPRP
jgi:hypothetical protein